MKYTINQLKDTAATLPIQFFWDAFAVSGHLKINLYALQLKPEDYKRTIALLVELAGDENHFLWHLLSEQHFGLMQTLASFDVCPHISSRKEHYLRFAGMQVIDEFIKFKKNDHVVKFFDDLKGINNDNKKNFKDTLEELNDFSSALLNWKYIHVRLGAASYETKVDAIIKMLANDKVRDHLGRTAFVIVAQNFSPYVAFLFLAAGVNVNTVSNYYKDKANSLMQTPNSALLLGNDVVDNTKIPSFFSYVTGAARSSSSSSENNTSNRNNNNNTHSNQNN